MSTFLLSFSFCETYYTLSIQAKYPAKEKKDDDDTIPDGSICVEEEMAMQNSPKLNTKPHKPEVKQ